MNNNTTILKNESGTQGMPVLSFVSGLSTCHKVAFKPALREFSTESEFIEKQSGGLPYERAIAALRRRKTTPTAENSREIADNWSAEAKTQSFFSARVAKADILEGMRFRINQVLEGKMTSGQAVDWIRTFLKTDGASSLKELGFGSVDEANETDSLSELASNRRLTLIVETNVRTAQAVGEYQAQLESKDSFPYVKYHSETDERTRPSHRILNGKIFRVGSPEHAAVTPPRGFHCRCYWRQLTEEEAHGLKIETEVPSAYTAAVKRENDPFTFNPAHGLFDGVPEAKPQWGEDVKTAYGQSPVHTAKGGEEPQSGVSSEESASRQSSKLKVQSKTKEGNQEKEQAKPGVNPDGVRSPVEEIVTGTERRNDFAPAVSLLEKGFKVESALGKEVEFNSHLVDKYVNGANKEVPEPGRLRNLGRAVQAVREANLGVYEQRISDSSSQRIFLHKIQNEKNADRLMIVFEYLKEGIAPYVGGFIYKEFKEKILLDYQKGTLLK